MKRQTGERRKKKGKEYRQNDGGRVRGRGGDRKGERQRLQSDRKRER